MEHIYSYRSHQSQSNENDGLDQKESIAFFIFIIQNLK